MNNVMKPIAKSKAARLSSSRFGETPHGHFADIEGSANYFFAAFFFFDFFFMAMVVILWNEGYLSAGGQLSVADLVLGPVPLP